MITSGLPMALSIRQPWAWLIVNGFKDLENRDWRTPFRGRVLIHTGKKHDGRPDEWDWPNIPKPASFDYGGIIGEAEIYDCVTKSTSPWFCGQFGFLLRNAKPLPFHPYLGKLGFFEVSLPL
jgi:hypothetical protein